VFDEFCDGRIRIVGQGESVVAGDVVVGDSVDVVVAGGGFGSLETGVFSTVTNTVTSIITIAPTVTNGIIHTGFDGFAIISTVFIVLNTKELQKKNVKTTVAHVCIGAHQYAHHIGSVEFDELLCVQRIFLQWSARYARYVG
jgi:hypothetical protein